MASVNIGGAQSYAIPLDSVDLTYLSKYIRSPLAEKRPLWTRKHLDGESEYCHVQIVTQDDDEDYYSEPFDTYKCHICNVRVPTMCYKEHNESEQHETIKNISQKFLERVSKQINISIINTDEDVVKDVYFCVPCSKIIRIENKNRHESTAYHVKSKKKISILSEFYKILKENESCDDGNDFNDEKDWESDVEPDNSKANNYVTTNNNLCNNFDSDDDSVDQSPVTNNLTMIPSLCNTENDVQPRNSVKTENFQEYLKEMTKKYNLKVNLPIFNGENISIVAPNGDTVKVSREHFQSYRQLKSSMYCQLCKMWISQDTRPHDVTETHVRNILKPINEKFARTIDTVSSHCVPCNEVVLTNSNHQTLNDAHKKIIKDTHTPKTSKTFCVDCNIYIDTHNYSVHIISKKHLSALMIKNSVQQTDTHTPKTSKTFCVDCNIYIDTYNYTVHIISKKHLSALMIKNSVQQTDKDNILLCKICKITVLKHNLNSHVTSKTHIAKKTKGATEINNKNNDATPTNNKSNISPAVGVKINEIGYCEVCKVKVPAGGMKIHVDGKPHKKVISQLCSENKTDTKPKENKAQSGAKPGSVAQNGSSVNTNTKNVRFAGTNSTSSAESSLSNATNISEHKTDAYYDLLEYTDASRTKVRCKVCFVNIVFNNKNIIEHMECKSHVEISNKKKMEVFNKLLLYTDDAKTKVKCEICDVNVPYIERNIIEHMEGRNHEIAENELLESHLITRESSGYNCECCEEDITDYYEHINSRTHTYKFQDKYEIDKKEMRKYVYEDDINNGVARRHRERYRNLLKYNDIFKINDTNYYCGICHIKMGRISEIDHVLGAMHALKLEEIEFSRS